MWDNKYRQELNLNSKISSFKGVFCNIIPVPEPGLRNVSQETVGNVYSLTLESAIHIDVSSTYSYRIHASVQFLFLSETTFMKNIITVWGPLILLSVGVIIRKPFQMICHKGPNIIYKSLMTCKHPSCLWWKMRPLHSMCSSLLSAGTSRGIQHHFDTVEGKTVKHKKTGTSFYRMGQLYSGNNTSIISEKSFHSITVAVCCFFRCVFVPNIQMRH